MSERLDDWYRDTEQRRRLSEADGPLVAALFDGAEPDDRSSVAVARVILESLSDRSVRLGIEQGASRANLDTGEVNLDAGILEADAPWPMRTERLIGVAAHEASHLRWTPLDSSPPDRLFRAIENILEDERIEARLARERRDFVHPLHVARRDVLQAAGPDGPFLSAFFTLVRCEERIHSKLWARYEERLLAAIEILTPFPETFEALRLASLQIALLVPPEERDLVPDFELFGCSIEVDGDADLAELLRRRRDREGRFPPPRVTSARSRSSKDWPTVVWSTAENARDGYERARGEVIARARVLSDRLRTMLPRRRAPHQTSGRIDRRRLYASPYSTRIFRAPGNQPPMLSIAILIDLSGSMGGRSARIAQQIAVLLSEAVRQLPDVQLGVFGHSADLRGTTSTEMVRFPLDAEGRPLGLGRVPILGNNRDAHALRELGAELQRSPLRTSRHRIAIVIADGAPSAREFSGPGAIRLTRDAITWLDHTWGPVLFIATTRCEVLREMVPGASFRFRAGDPIEELSRHLTSTLKRSLRGSR